MTSDAAQTASLAEPRRELALCARPPVDSRERMPGQVAHDLRGIVAIIQGYAELVPLEPSQKLQAEYCGKIRRACRRMLDMVDRSIERGRQDSDVLVLKKKEIVVASFLGDCLAAQTVKAHDKGMILSLEMGTGMPNVSVDPGCLERVLSNLLENAIKFSHPTGTIKLSAQVVGDSLEIEVMDGGQGIPEKDFATLFDAYRTGSARPTGGERSTGLGLSIVKELVLAHHGVVGVRSEVGHGSTFSVRLPLDRADIPPAGLAAVERAGTGSPSGPEARGV
jgi:signal transduction histidine kinase